MSRSLPVPTITWLPTTIGAVVEKYCWLKSAISCASAPAGLRVERHEVVVGRRHVEIAVPHAEAAIGDVRAAPGLPVVVPQLAAVARVDRPRVVGRRHVERAVDHQRRALDAGAAAGGEIAGALAADDHVAAAAAAAAAGAGSRPVRPIVHASVRFFTVRRLTWVNELYRLPV